MYINAPLNTTVDTLTIYWVKSNTYVGQVNNILITTATLSPQVEVYIGYINKSSY